MILARDARSALAAPPAPADLEELDKQAADKLEACVESRKRERRALGGVSGAPLTRPVERDGAGEEPYTEVLVTSESRSEGLTGWEIYQERIRGKHGEVEGNGLTLIVVDAVEVCWALDGIRGERRRWGTGSWLWVLLYPFPCCGRGACTALAMTTACFQSEAPRTLMEHAVHETPN